MDYLTDSESIEQIDIAITFLKNKKILLSIISGNKTYFVEKKNKVLILNANSSLLLNYEEFKKLYEKVTFFIYEEKEESYDFAKDDEYYSWKHK